MHFPKNVNEIWRAKIISNVTAEEEGKCGMPKGQVKKSKYHVQYCFREICQINVVLNCLEDHHFYGAECQ